MALKGANSVSPQCASKPVGSVPKGKCSAWSWNPGAKTCWMKTSRGSKPNPNGDISGVVVPAPCTWVPDTDYYGGHLGNVGVNITRFMLTSPRLHGPFCHTGR